jgi:hypothetical protein
MQSSANLTGLPSARSISGRTMRSEYFGSGPPFGRPKWDSSTTRAPLSVRAFTVGTSRSILVASVTWPSLAGTLRSARTSTVLPFTSS